MVEQSLLHVTLNMNRRQQTRHSEASLEAIERFSVLIQKSEFKIRNDKGKVTRRDHAIVTHLVKGCCN
jgi:hypothetical protein